MASRQQNVSSSRGGGKPSVAPLNYFSPRPPAAVNAASAASTPNSTHRIINCGGGSGSCAPPPSAFAVLEGLRVEIGLALVALEQQEQQPSDGRGAPPPASSTDSTAAPSGAPPSASPSTSQQAVVAAIASRVDAIAALCRRSLTALGSLSQMQQEQQSTASSARPSVGGGSGASVLPMIAPPPQRRGASGCADDAEDVPSTRRPSAAGAEELEGVAAAVSARAQSDVAKGKRKEDPRQQQRDASSMDLVTIASSGDLLVGEEGSADTCIGNAFILSVASGAANTCTSSSQHRPSNGSNVVGSTATGTLPSPRVGRAAKGASGPVVGSSPRRPAASGGGTNAVTASTAASPTNNSGSSSSAINASLLSLMASLGSQGLSVGGKGSSGLREALSMANGATLTQTETASYGQCIAAAIYFVLESVLVRTQCDRLSLFVRNEGSGVLALVANVGAGTSMVAKEVPVSPSGVVQHVFNTRIAANLVRADIEDAAECRGPSAARNTLVFPLVSVAHPSSASPPFGVIQLVNKRRGAAPFGPSDELLLHAMGPSIACILERYPTRLCNFPFDITPLHRWSPLPSYKPAEIDVADSLSAEPTQLVFHRVPEGGASTAVRYAKAQWAQHARGIDTTTAATHLMDMDRHMRMLEDCWRGSIEDNMKLERLVEQKEHHIHDARDIITRKQKKLDLMKNVLCDEIGRHLKGESALHKTAGGL